MGSKVLLPLSQGSICLPLVSCLSSVDHTVFLSCFSLLLFLAKLAPFAHGPLCQSTFNQPPKREIWLVARHPWVGWPWVRCIYLWAVRVGPPGPAESVSCWGISQWKGLFSSKLQPIADCVIANSKGESSCFSDKHSRRIILHIPLRGN